MRERLAAGRAGCSRGTGPRSRAPPARAWARNARTRPGASRASRALLRSQPYSPAQKNVSPPATCSTSTDVDAAARAARRARPRRSRRRPARRRARRRRTRRPARSAPRRPPSMRSRSPNGVLTESKAIDPTTVTDMRAGRLSCARRACRPDRASSVARRCSSSPRFRRRGPAKGEVLIRVTRAGVNFADTIAREQLPREGDAAADARRRGRRGTREDTASASRRSARAAATPSTRRPAARTFPIPDGVATTAPRSLLSPGHDRVAPAPDLRARSRPARRVVVHSARRRRGLDRRGARAAHGRGPRDRERLDRREARTRARARCGRGDRCRSRGMTDALIAANDGRARRCRTRRGRREHVRCVARGARAVRATRRLRDRGPPPERAAHGRCCAARTRSSASGWRTRWSARRWWPTRCASFSRLVADGRLAVLAGGTYPLAQAAQAHIDLAARRTTGKLLIDPWADRGAGHDHPDGPRAGRRERPASPPPISCSSEQLCRPRPVRARPQGGA